MTATQQRQNLLSLLEQARSDGATLDHACVQIGLTARSVQRWRRPVVGQSDRRISGKRHAVRPANQLSEPERQAVLAVLNSDEYKDLPPSQVVPRLADKQIYLACESTMYRLLREAGQLAHRRAERPPQKCRKPRALQATQPNQVYCWDITYLPTQVRGESFYLYLFEDLFSRKIVGWQVFDSESAEQASQLLQDICTRLKIAPAQLTVHSDNGSPMKGETMLSTMQRLGVAHTRSRPAVSNDNPYVESIFRTLKYRPQLPVKPFADLLAARRWMTALAGWYNDEHRHSAIGFITPAQRHAGLDQAMLKQRAQVYALARQSHPRRWSGQARVWAYVDTVHLNPDKPESKEAETLKKAA
jgi:transposase InsO family protein